MAITAPRKTLPSFDVDTQLYLAQRSGKLSGPGYDIEALKASGHVVPSKTSPLGVKAARTPRVTPPPLPPDIKLPTGITIGITPEELQRIETAKAKGQCVGAMKAYYTVKTYKVTLRGGGLVLVQALDSKTAKQKAQAAGYKVAWVTKKLRTETAEVAVSMNVYTITFEDGTTSTICANSLSEARKLAGEDVVKASEVSRIQVAPEDAAKLTGALVIVMPGGEGSISLITVEQATWFRETSFYGVASGSDAEKIGITLKKIEDMPKEQFADGTWLPLHDLKDKDGNVLIAGWEHIPEKYRVIAKVQGLDAMTREMEGSRIEAGRRLTQAGFTEDKIPEVTMSAYGSVPLRGFTIPNMAEFARNNTDGMDVLRDYGFPDDVLGEVGEFNKQALTLVDYIDKSISTSKMIDGVDILKSSMSFGEERALSRALDALGVKREVSEMRSVWADDVDELTVWRRLGQDEKIAVALLFDKDYTKGSNLSSITQDLRTMSSKNLALQLVYGMPVAIMNPFGKMVTLDDAKKQLGDDYKAELDVLSNYIQKNGAFDVEKIKRDFEARPDLQKGVLDATGYKDKKQLLGSLEYYNYGTTVTSKEWAVAGLTAGLIVVPFAGKALSTLGIVGSVLKHGVPAALGGLMLPDTIRMVKDPDVSVGSKVLAATITAALLSGAIIGVGKFAFRELRQFVKPGTFEASGVSLEVSIPRAQLKGNMTPKMAQTLVRDLERVWSGKLPANIEKIVENFPTPEEFQAWYSTVVRHGIMTTQVRGIASGISRGSIKGRANPFQAALNDNILFSVKPDMVTYGRIIGRSKVGIDTTPTGSMEWWSPNFSGDVAGWYLGKVKQFVPGGKLLRYSPKDIRAIPQSVYVQVAEQIQKNPKLWEAWKGRAYMKGDKVTALNYLIAREVYRRAILPIKHPDALPPGVYPVFKFHWSRLPSGKLRPTWELEMITPAGFQAHTFKPVRYLDKFNTGGRNTPTVASLTVRSPVQGKDIVSGQQIRLGQPMPVIITATRNAIAEGRGLPSIRELYAAKYVYRPIATIQNIFSRGKVVRPRSTEASMVTTPRVYLSRTIKLKGPKVNPADARAKDVLLKMPEHKRLSTSEVAAKVEGTKPDVHGRFAQVRDPYYHPIYDYADNWVAPRTAIMLRHPTIKGAYIVVQDTSKASQPGVWDIVGGQWDTLGKVRVNRPFGRSSPLEAAQEQLISELGIRARNLKPGMIHMAKTTEHSAYATYMFDGTAGSLKFKIPMNKWYDMVKGEWVIEPEVAAVGVLKSGQRASVTPALYVELARRGFDVRNLVVVDRGLPTSGVGQYLRGTYEYNILKQATIVKPKNIILTDPIWQARNNQSRITAWQDADIGGPSDFIVPTSYRDPRFTGLVPTLRPPMNYAPVVAVERVSSIEGIPDRVLPPVVDMEYPITAAWRRDIPEMSVEEELSSSFERRYYESRPTEGQAFASYVPIHSKQGMKKVTSFVPVSRQGSKVYIPVTSTYVPYATVVGREPYVPIRGVARYPRLVIQGGKKYYKIPRGSIAWRQGLFWKYIPPPWMQEKPITIKYPPEGAQFIGEKTPEQTIQMIGKPKAKVPKTVTIDLGVVDIKIDDYGRSISFTGGGLETVAGHSILSPTKGMSIPGRGRVTIKRAKKRRLTPSASAV